jgi:triphosphoribosyl-dephospho-CoA synthetase
MQALLLPSAARHLNFRPRPHGDHALELRANIHRAYILAQSLEPLAEKPDCTTRTRDSSPGTKLEYFIISAANSALPILEMTDLILTMGCQPDCLFEFAYRAQLNSPRNRFGGKVNYAQILMMVPIIAAQCLLLSEGHRAPDTATVLARATEAMQMTTPRDVAALQMFVDLARELSERHHQRLGTTRSQLYPRFEGRYQTIFDAAAAEDFGHTMMATEIRNGYPVCMKVFEDLSMRGTEGIIPRSEAVYRDLRRTVGRHDIAADCIVVGFYLSFFGDPDAVLFP